MNDLTPLSDLVSLSSGGTPSKANPSYWGGDIPWLTPKDMNAFTGDTTDHVTSDALGNGTRLAPPETIFIAVRGMSLHKEIRIVKAQRAMAFNQDIKALMPGVIDRVYLFYALQYRIPELLGSVEAAGHGTGVLPTGRLAALTIPRFEHSVEVALGKFMAALDDKIELNRRMSATLEGMAQAIFRDWFVDFGPTRRKLAGLTDPVAIMGTLAPDLGLAAPLAALFPPTFGDNGLPQGWGERRVDDVMELAYGKALNKTVRSPGNIPVYGSGGVNGFHNQAIVDGPAIIVGRKGTVGTLYWEDKNCFPIDTVFYVVPKSPLVYCYYLLQTLGLEGMNTDAAVPGLNRNNVYRLGVAFEASAADAFANIGTVMRDAIGHRERESATLAATRDLLLPKLMSGEIRLRDAEKLVEAAT